MQYIQANAPRLIEPRHQQILDDAHRTIQELRAKTATYFAEAVEGKHLKATCPWCGGRKLRFRLIGYAHPELVIRCETGLCDPGPDRCGAWTGQGFSLPTWPQWEWQWLALQLNNHESTHGTGQ